MNVKKVNTENLKYKGVPTKVTTVYFDVKVEGQKLEKEGLRLCIYEDAVNPNRFKLIEGLAGRFEKNVKFKEYSQDDAMKAYEIFFAYAS